MTIRQHHYQLSRAIDTMDFTFSPFFDMFNIQRVLCDDVVTSLTQPRMEIFTNLVE